ncbi:hypothetical protein Tco_1038322, partial [Tanacetum coccineum]
MKYSEYNKGKGYNSCLLAIDDVRNLIEEPFMNRENVYSAIGNRDHTQAVIALMLYCLENRQPFNLAYFIIRMMYFFRDRKDKVLPYGMILTRLFKNLKANMAQDPFDERTKGDKGNVQKLGKSIAQLCKIVEEGMSLKEG